MNMQSNNTGKTYSPEKSMAIARQAARSAVSNGHISIFKIMDSYQIGRDSAKLLFNSLIVCGIIDHSGTSLIRKESEIPETLSRLHFQFLDPEGEWQRQTQVRLGLEGGNSELQEEMKAYYLAEHDHIRNFNLWRKENLDPQVMILAGMAATDPQYDGNYLYRLERQKLICMRTYFSNCRFTKEGIDRRNYWIDICIRLLMYIENNGIDIPDESIRKMNIRNIAT